MATGRSRAWSRDSAPSDHQGAMHRTWKHPVAIGRCFSSEFRETSDIGDIGDIGARLVAEQPERQQGQSATTNWRTIPQSSRTAFPLSQPCPTVSPSGSGVRECLIVTIPVGLPLATGIERGQAQAIARAVRSAAGARHEDLVERADLESAVAVLRADTDRALRSQGAGILRWRRRFGCCRSEVGVRLALMRLDSAAGSGVAPKPAAGVFTRGLRAIAAFRRCRPRTGR